MKLYAILYAANHLDGDTLVYETETLESDHHPAQVQAEAMAECEKRFNTDEYWGHRIGVTFVDVEDIQPTVMTPANLSHLYKYELVSDSCMVVFAASYTNPIGYLPAIQSQLKDFSGGTVIFDLRLSVGNSSNRFIKAHFSNGAFDRSSFEVTNYWDVEQAVRDKCEEFWRSHQDLTTNSVILNPSLEVKP